MSTSIRRAAAHAAFVMSLLAVMATSQRTWNLDGAVVRGISVVPAGQTVWHTDVTVQITGGPQFCREVRDVELTIQADAAGVRDSGMRGRVVAATQGQHGAWPIADGGALATVFPASGGGCTQRFTVEWTRTDTDLSHGRSVGWSARPKARATVEPPRGAQIAATIAP